MPQTRRSSFAAEFTVLSPQVDSYVPDIVDLLLRQARGNRASDIHLIPEDDGLRVQWRIDGVLETVAVLHRELSPRIVARLKVLCGLLTYRTDIPQEGRVAREYSASEVRVATFPTLYGEKAAVRLFAESHSLQRLEQLGLPPRIESALLAQLQATDGVILLTGPSGSGKTTTVYACLREILAESADARSVMTLEDPIEVAVSGITQSQVRPTVGFDLAGGIRSLMRQDPDVIMVGEIRDQATAEVVFQAALTGHLVLTTFHAGSAVEAVTRLLDMGIEPYILRSTLRSVVCQRLLRRRRAELPSPGIPEFLPNPESSSDNRGASGAPVTAGTEYLGRLVIAELLNPDVAEIAGALLQRHDARQLAAVARAAGFRTLRDAAADAVAAGLTTEAEVFRVLGRNSQGSAKE